MTSAAMKNVLVYHDGPQVALFQTELGDAIGVAITREGMDAPFFIACVGQKHLRLYMDQALDLNGLMRLGTHHFFCDAMHPSTPCLPATKEEMGDDTIWPDKDFFASSHTL